MSYIFYERYFKEISKEIQDINKVHRIVPNEKLIYFLKKLPTKEKQIIFCQHKTIILRNGNVKNYLIVILYGLSSAINKNGNSL